MAEDPRKSYAKDPAPARKPAAKRAPAKKSAAKKTATPAARLAEGGGPEDPLADAAALKAAAKQRSEQRAENRERRAAESHAARQQRAAPAKAPKAKRVVSWAWSGSRRLLTAEFLICLVVLLLGFVLSRVDAQTTATADKQAAKPGTDAAIHAMVKGSALAGLFFLLAILQAGGKGPAKAATALGTLVTATYVLTSADVHQIVSWINSFFAPPKAVESLQPNPNSTSSTGSGNG